jgi:ATP-grasp domain, R2K clade family 3
MKPCILFRQDNSYESEEIDSMHQHFRVYRQRSQIPQGSLVVGRNSVLPYYRELEQDLLLNGSKMLVGHNGHQYLADIGQWYSDLAPFTFKTWSWDEFVRTDHQGPFVLKGATNSKKRQWKTHMYAENRLKAVQVMLRLMDDSLVSTQGVYVREYVPLKSYGTNVVGQPITDEYRLFMFRDQVLAKGYYWSSNSDEIGIKPDPATIPPDLIHEIATIVREHTDAYVMDLAQTEDGRWMLVELNSLEMSGISDCNPDELYRNLARCMNELERSG